MVERAQRLVPHVFNIAAAPRNGLLSRISQIGYNLDNVVDAADYTIWRDTLGSTNDLRANGDDTGASAGVIDRADYSVWVDNFGASCPLAVRAQAYSMPSR